MEQLVSHAERASDSRPRRRRRPHISKCPSSALARPRPWRPTSWRAHAPPTTEVCSTVHGSPSTTVARDHRRALRTSPPSCARWMKTRSVKSPRASARARSLDSPRRARRFETLCTRTTSMSGAVSAWTRSRTERAPRRRRRAKADTGAIAPCSSNACACARTGCTSAGTPTSSPGRRLWRTRSAATWWRIIGTLDSTARASSCARRRRGGCAMKPSFSRIERRARARTRSATEDTRSTVKIECAARRFDRNRTASGARLIFGFAFGRTSPARRTDWTSSR